MKKQESVRLEAEPESLEIDLNRLAVFVIDMQNAFVSKGGMFDLWGFDISTIPAIIGPINRIMNAARTKGVMIIHFSLALSPDAREVGPMSTFYNDKLLQSYREKPEMRDSLLMRGTWGVETIDELKPRKDEILIEKPRFSAFIGTGLDSLLRSHDIKYLVFTGVATNICVESSLRDACHREYLSVLISDAAAASPPSSQESTIANVIQCFGWVTDTEKLLKIFQ
jgi:ureidoacrylate peracid hydrolase